MDTPWGWTNSRREKGRKRVLIYGNSFCPTLLHVRNLRVFFSYKLNPLFFFDVSIKFFLSFLLGSSKPIRVESKPSSLIFGRFIVLLKLKLALG